MIPVFDGHNDFLQRMVAAGSGRDALWQDGDGSGHLDLQRMKAGGLFGGFFAIWIPSAQPLHGEDRMQAMETPPFDIPLDPAVPHDMALPHAIEQAGQLLAMERAGTVSVVSDAAGILDCQKSGRIAAVMHMEGAEAIRDPDALHLWHRIGLRSLGPVWSRPTAYAHGVPFAFPADPDTGSGLTARGEELVRECNRLRIMIDLAHMNAAGIRDVARLSDAPLVSSHSAAHAVAPSSRNLTDDQLRMIAESGGLVGLNFATGFLRPDGRRQPFEGFERMLRHLDHLLEILGEDGVALGSDFDGALMPVDLPDASAVPALLSAMNRHGYGEKLIENIAWRNWVGLLRRTWGG